MGEQAPRTQPQDNQEGAVRYLVGSGTAAAAPQFWRWVRIPSVTMVGSRSHFDALPVLLRLIGGIGLSVFDPTLLLYSISYSYPTIIT